MGRGGGRFLCVDTMIYRLALALSLAIAAGCDDGAVTSTGGVDPQGGQVRYDYCEVAVACGYWTDIGSCLEHESDGFAACEAEYLAEWSCAIDAFHEADHPYVACSSSACTDAIWERQECTG
jgi:hypothetical protein